MNNSINKSGSEVEPCSCCGTQNSTAQLMMPLSILNKNCETKQIRKLVGIIAILVGLYLVIVLTSVGEPLFNSGMSGKSPNNKDILPVLSVTVPRGEKPDTYNIEVELKEYGHKVQLAAERYSVDDPIGYYAKSIDVLNQQGYGTTYTNPVTRKPGKVVAYGIFSAGDFSYLLTNAPLNDGYMIIVYGVDNKPITTNPIVTSSTRPIIKGYGGEGAILILQSGSCRGKFVYPMKYTDSVNNQVYTVTQDKDGGLVFSK